MLTSQSVVPTPTRQLFFSKRQVLIHDNLMQWFLNIFFLWSTFSEWKFASSTTLVRHTISFRNYCSNVSRRGNSVGVLAIFSLVSCIHEDCMNSFIIKQGQALKQIGPYLIMKLFIAEWSEACWIKCHYQI